MSSLTNLEVAILTTLALGFAIFGAIDLYRTHKQNIDKD